MERVYKYSLQPVQDRQPVMMPKGARILTAQVQHGNICLWALVNPDAPLVERYVRIHGTGHDIVGGIFIRYIASGQLYGGDFVFHVFEELEGMTGIEELLAQEPTNAR